MKMKNFVFLFVLFSCVGQFGYAEYSMDWWKVIPKEEAKNWEILPQEVKPGEVILSKRTELGVFSNLGYAPFIMDGELYNSVEGLWQGMKYPDEVLKDDPRMSVNSWSHTRKEVYLLSGWESKIAGNEANEIYKKNSFKLISYKNIQFTMKDEIEGENYHYKIISRAIREKVLQNPQVRDLLLKTKGLILKPDHHITDSDPPSYQYHKILMKIRDELID